MTQFKHAVNIFWRLDDGFVLEHRRDDGVSNGAPGGEELFGEKRRVIGNGEEGEDGLVRVDRCNEERCEI